MSDRIEINPAVCHGKPVIRGTRVPVTIVLGSLAAGMSFQDVEREYDVTADDIRAALSYATGLVDEERHFSLPAGT